MVQKKSKKINKLAVKKFFIIAGEASGDLLGAKLIKELKVELEQKNQKGEFIGVGGKMMEKEGLKSIFDIKELSLMGFAEIVPHIPKLLKRIKQTAEEIIKHQPDFVITIDAPDFNFRVIKRLNNLAKQKNQNEPRNKCGVTKSGNEVKNFLNPKKIHLIAPSVWAYRENRAQKISKLYDLLLAILPFEPPYFTKHGLKTVFIGHPIIENAPDFSQKEKIRADFRRKYKIKKDEILIVVTPGSRNGEVKKIFPEFIQAINLLKNNKIKIVIPLIDKTEKLVRSMAGELKNDYFFADQKEKSSAFFAADFALAKSGTNTLELSLYKLPMIIAYKAHFLTYLIIKIVAKVRFANLINIISNKEIIPEMLQNNCERKKLSALLGKLISDKKISEKQISESTLALKLLGLEAKSIPSKKAAQEILKLKN